MKASWTMPSRLLDFAVVAMLNTLFLVAVWIWADIRPESSWLRSPPDVALVLVAPNFGSTVLLWRTRSSSVAGMATATALTLAGAYVAWDERGAMTYDRTSISAMAESVIYVLATLTIAGLGFACLLLFQRVVRDSRYC